ncbi:MAG: shikimate dehydrogenase [Turicibacter sp.]|nr:shikimate dehydrogenase [Turicibacter sp.]
MNPNGKTAVYGVMGDPIQHTLSPQIHAYFAEFYGVNMTYTPLHVKSEMLETAVRGAHALNIKGLNITVPHKKAVLPFLSNLDTMAEKIGSVNTLEWTPQGYKGYNTDYLGIKHSLDLMNVGFSGRTVTVIGAGGGAYAACMAAAEFGAKHITIFNRTKENANALANQLKKCYNIDVAVAKSPSDVVIQTTTLGFGTLQDYSPIASLDFFEGVELAFDIIYTPQKTIFLRQAEEAKVPKVINGLPMLIYQAFEAFVIWNESIAEAGELPHEQVKLLQERLAK